MSDQLAKVAKLLGEPARAAMLLELMSGRSLPAGRLASTANVTPQTASEHLSRLTRGGFVIAHQQGRHRYYSLAAPEVADAIESMLVLAGGASGSQRLEDTVPSVGTLEHARTCYAHLAGWLGVRIAESLQQSGHLRPSAGRTFSITESGRVWLENLGVEVPISQRPRFARQCLDWTERRPHLSGPLGIALYQRFVDLHWVMPRRNTRAVRITLEGRQALAKLLRITIV